MLNSVYHMVAKDPARYCVLLEAHGSCFLLCPRPCIILLGTWLRKVFCEWYLLLVKSYLYNDERRGDSPLYAVFSHIDIFSQKLIMQGESISNLLGDEMNALN